MSFVSIGSHNLLPAGGNQYLEQERNRLVDQEQGSIKYTSNLLPAGGNQYLEQERNRLVDQEEGSFKYTSHKKILIIFRKETIIVSKNK